MTQRERKHRHSQYVDYQMAAQFDLPHRLAWATEVVSRVVNLYSPHFQEKYLQQRAVDFARRFVLGQTTDDADRRSVIHAIEDLVEDAEAEGYNRNLLAPGVHLLIEIETDDGKGCTNAVDYASIAFASHVFYCQGVRGTGMPVEYADSVGDNIYAFAWELFRMLSQSEHLPIASIPFGSVRFDATFPPLPHDVILRSKRIPPRAESDFLSMRS